MFVFKSVDFVEEGLLLIFTTNLVQWDLRIRKPQYLELRIESMSHEQVKLRM